MRRLRSSGRPVIAIDADQLSTVAPDLIITQGLCEVCAVSDGEVPRLATGLQGRPRVMSLAARDLAGIWSNKLVLGLRARLLRLRGSTTARQAQVLCIEWLDPPYLAGHWVPELVAAAGGKDIGAEPGTTPPGAIGRS